MPMIVGNGDGQNYRKNIPDYQAAQGQQVEEISIQIVDVEAKKTTAQAEVTSTQLTEQTELQYKEAEVAAFQAEVQAMQAEVASSSAEVTSKTSVLTQASAQVQSCASQLSAAQTGVQSAQSALSNAQAQLSAANAMPDEIEIQDENGEIIKCANPAKQSAVAAAQNAIAIAQAQVEAANSQLSTAQNAYNEALTSQAQAQADLESARAELETIQAQYQTEQSEAAAAQAEVDSAQAETETEIADLQTELSTYDQELAALQAQLAIAQEAQAKAIAAAAEAEQMQKEPLTDYHVNDDGSVSYSSTDEDGKPVQKDVKIEPQTSSIVDNGDGSVTRTYSDGSTETTEIVRNVDGTALTKTVKKDQNGKVVSTNLKSSADSETQGAENKDCVTDPFVFQIGDNVYTLVQAGDNKELDDTSEFFGADTQDQIDWQEMIADGVTADELVQKGISIEYHDVNDPSKKQYLSTPDEIKEALGEDFKIENYSAMEAKVLTVEGKTDSNDNGIDDVTQIASFTVITNQNGEKVEVQGYQTIDDTEFIADKYGIDPVESGGVTGAVYATETQPEDSENKVIDIESLSDEAKARLVLNEDGTPKTDEHGNPIYKVGTWGVEGVDCTTPIGVMKSVYGEETQSWTDSETQALYNALMEANGAQDSDRIADGTHMLYAQSELTLYSKEALKEYVEATSKENVTPEEKAQALETLKNSGNPVEEEPKTQNPDAAQDPDATEEPAEAEEVPLAELEDGVADALKDVFGVDQDFETVQVQKQGDNTTYTVTNKDGSTVAVTYSPDGEDGIKETSRIITTATEKTTIETVTNEENNISQLVLTKTELKDGEETGLETSVAYNAEYSNETANEAIQGKLDENTISAIVNKIPRANDDEEEAKDPTIVCTYYSQGEITKMNVIYADEEGDSVSEEVTSETYAAFVENHPELGLEDKKIGMDSIKDEVAPDAAPDTAPDTSTPQGAALAQATEIMSGIEGLDSSTIELQPQTGDYQTDDIQTYTAKGEDGQSYKVTFTVDEEGKLKESSRSVIEDSVETTYIPSGDGISVASYSLDENNQRINTLSDNTKFYENVKYDSETINDLMKDPESLNQNLTMVVNTTKDNNGVDVFTREHYKNGKCEGIEVDYKTEDGRTKTQKLTLEEYQQFANDNPDLNLKEDIKLAADYNENFLVTKDPEAAYARYSELLTTGNNTWQMFEDNGRMSQMLSNPALSNKQKVELFYIAMDQVGTGPYSTNQEKKNYEAALAQVSQMVDEYIGEFTAKHGNEASIDGSDFTKGASPSLVTEEDKKFVEYKYGLDLLNNLNTIDKYSTDTEKKTEVAEAKAQVQKLIDEAFNSNVVSPKAKLEMFKAVTKNASTYGVFSYFNDLNVKNNQTLLNAFSKIVESGDFEDSLEFLDAYKKVAGTSLDSRVKQWDSDETDDNFFNSMIALYKKAEGKPENVKKLNERFSINTMQYALSGDKETEKIQGFIDSLTSNMPEGSEGFGISAQDAEAYADSDYLKGSAKDSFYNILTAYNEGTITPNQAAYLVTTLVRTQGLDKVTEGLRSMMSGNQENCMKYLAALFGDEKFKLQ